MLKENEDSRESCGGSSELGFEFTFFSEIPLSSCVAISKAHNFSKTQSPHL